MSGSGDDARIEYQEALRIQLEEYRAVIENQIEWINRIDQKASVHSRFVLIIAGVVATAVIGFPSRFPRNLGVSLSVVLLVASFIMGIITQTSAELQTGPSANYVNGMKAHRPTEIAHLERLVSDYSRWVAGNETIVARFANYLFLTQVLLILGVLSLAIGIGWEVLW